MSCGQICQKLWKNYLNKYGDYRERLQLIQENEQQCLKQFRLPPIRKRSKIDEYHVVEKNKTELDQLEKIIDAEDFPDNIFNSSSIGNELERDDSQLLTSSLNTNTTKQSVQKSEQLTTTHDRMMSQPRNPYAQFLKRFHQTKKIAHQPLDSQIDPQLHKHIQKFLLFLQSLDQQQTSIILDENTLIDLFSIDNHLTSSMFIPAQIQQINNIPKAILDSLKDISIENEMLTNKNRVNMNKASAKTILDKQKSIFAQQDAELNSRLSNTYIIKAFKEYLLQRNPSARLPNVVR